MDVCGALIGLLLAAPVLLAVAFFIRLTMGSPVLFLQRRPGQGGRPFTLVKFRTMADLRDDAGVLRPDARRLTSVGRWLRRTSLDELPELINVLLGHMSLVGPRPLLLEYLDVYTPRQARRHEVKPGLTGWAQVNGRNAVTWEERFELDVWYVDNWSLRLDLRILWLTLVKTIRREGIGAPGHDTTMPRFEGGRDR
ncbi:MAG: sugar transferase [bacterium]|nr:sugar transferase [bacterium]